MRMLPALAVLALAACSAPGKPDSASTDTGSAEGALNPSDDLFQSGPLNVPANEVDQTTPPDEPQRQVGDA
jgi:hypothetical protein